MTEGNVSAQQGDYHPKLTGEGIDAYTELVAAETALRQIVRLLLGESWRDDFSLGKLATLERRRDEEGQRRDGVGVSQDLLDYTETHQLESLINKHWAELKPVLNDKNRTSAYLGIMLVSRVGSDFLVGV